jgi:hypothetical protein
MFTAKYERVSHTISIPPPSLECIALITAEGEQHWAPYWKPTFLDPVDGSPEKGMVFLTSHGNEDTYWAMVDYDPAGGYLRYSRLTPGSRSVLVRAGNRRPR